MGKLTITGKAKREVAYDTAILSVRFNTHSDTSAEALKTITKQSEEFLNILNDSGISAESIQLGDSHVDQDYDDGKLDAYASKEFKINMLIDMPFINSILELISDKGYAVDVDFEYHVTNEAAIHEELLQEALAQSKKNAEAIAATMNQKIIGIDTLEYGRYGGDVHYLSCEQERGCVIGESHTAFSNRVKSPTTTLSESIEVVWIME